MNDESLYKFIGKVALEFRLSLDNVCKILGKHPTLETKLEVRNRIDQTAILDENLRKRYNYLFDYETFDEPEEISRVAYFRAYSYIRQYNKALNINDEEKIKEKNSELNKTLIDFNNLKHRLHDRLTHDDIAVISRYRIKYLISRERFCENFDIREGRLRAAEERLSPGILKTKLKLLPDYYNKFANEKYGRSFK